MINLNRFRKKKAKEEKEKRAETNRRLHGRTKAERALDAAEKKRLEDKLNGAFLVREDVRLSDIPNGDEPDAFEQLERAAERAMNVSEFRSPEPGSEPRS